MKDWRDYFAEKVKTITPLTMRLTMAGRTDELNYSLLKRMLEAKKAALADELGATGLSQTDVWKEIRSRELKSFLDAEAQHYITSAYEQAVLRWRREYPNTKNPL